jgi:hypothetical protein
VRNTVHETFPFLPMEHLIERLAARRLFPNSEKVSRVGKNAGGAPARPLSPTIGFAELIVQ